MKKEWEEFRASLSDVLVMNKKEFLLTGAVCVLGGIVLGMLLSPRRSVVIGSNNGHNSEIVNRGEDSGEDRGKKGRKAAEKIADWSEVEEKELNGEEA